MSGATILVVDDEPQIRRVMRSTLSTHGYVITEAMTGEDGRRVGCARIGRTWCCSM